MTGITPDYTSAMITAVFTGIGTAIGLALYEGFLKEKIQKAVAKVKQVPEKLQNHISPSPDSQ